MTYELWDTRGTNIVGAFNNECDALALVLSGIERNGPEDTNPLVLALEDEDGDTHTIAQGKELADRAPREFAGQSVAG
jgi:hypothetical protein